MPNNRNRNPRQGRQEGQEGQGTSPRWVKEATGNQGAEFESSMPTIPAERETETRSLQDFNFDDITNDPEIQALNETYGEYRRKFVGQGVSKGEDILRDSRMYPIKRIEEYVNWATQNGHDGREAFQHAKQVLLELGEDIAGNWRNVPDEAR